MVEADSDDEDDEDKKEREEQKCLAAHQARKLEADKSEAKGLVDRKLQEEPVPLHGVKPKNREPVIIATPKITFRKRDIMEVPKE